MKTFYLTIALMMSGMTFSETENEIIKVSEITTNLSAEELANRLREAASNAQFSQSESTSVSV